MMTNRSLALMLSSAVARLVHGAKSAGNALERAGNALGLLPKKRKYAPAEYGTRRPLSAEHYYLDGHGTIHRHVPKRDKSISARQWKKQRRRLRELAKIAGCEFRDAVDVREAKAILA